MNKHSILFKINIIFAIAFFAMLFMIFSFFHFESREKHHGLFDKISEVSKILPIDKWESEYDTLYMLCKSKGLEIVDGVEKTKIIEDDIKHRPPNMNPQLRPPMHPVHYMGIEYAIFEQEALIIVFKLDKELLDDFPVLTTAFAVVVLPMLVLLYFFIRKSILPINEMRRQIKAYGDAKPIEQLDTTKQDEISILYREFYESVQKVQRMQNARKVFLRNIMHELNTPIAKGKLITAMSTSQDKDILENIFQRLELLVKELSDTEKFSSGSYKIEKKEYRVIDIIDHARDLLYIEDDIENDVSNQTIRCDFEMMGLVFKNLIDNFLKYSTEHHISCDGNKINFISKGEKLNYPLHHYTEAFVKGDGYENSSNGLGLGLYIVKDMLKKQGFSLGYEHENGKNIFSIS
jgi:two-component system OmpR family sensor kinase